MPRHFLDHASSSPLRPEVAAAIASLVGAELFFDPGRPYLEGRQTSELIERARSKLADLLGVTERRIVFTSGGTEAVNLANGSARARAAPGAPVLCGGVEHSAVRLSAEASGPVVEIDVDTTGRVDLDHLADLLAHGPSPALVHCQAGNHEVGTVQPVAAVLALCREYGVPLHVDACMALGHHELDLGALGADLVSLSAHKAGGPPGIGALVLAPTTRVTPQMLGGDQERARRAGMENLIGIVGFGALAERLAAPGVLAGELARGRAQSERLAQAAVALEGVARFGDPCARLSHIACFGIADVEAEAVLLGLDQTGIAVHSGSACSSESFEPSPVLAAMGVDADHSLRCSVGWSTTEEDVAAFEAALPLVLDSLRRLRA